jgi:quercetin dioxygenase-like cupin family protein
MNENLKRLKELTEQLTKPPIPSSARKWVRYEAGLNHRAFAAGLYKSELVSVMLFFCEAGSEFDEHWHPGKEWGVILSGRAEITCGSETRICCNDDKVIFFPAGEPHLFHALQDTWVVFVSSPGDEDYPDVTA